MKELTDANIAELWEPIETSPLHNIYNWPEIEKRDEVQAVLKCNAAAKGKLVVYALDRILRAYEQSRDRKNFEGRLMTLRHHLLAAYLLSRLMKSKLPVSPTELLPLVLRLGTFYNLCIYSLPFLTPLVAWLESPSFGEALNEEHRVALGKMAKAVLSESYGNSADVRKLGARFLKLANLGAPPLRPGDVWSDAVLAELKDMATNERQAWVDLLLHCSEVSTGSPSEKWLKKSAELVNAIGEDPFVSRISKWFPLVDKPRVATDDHGVGNYRGQDGASHLNEMNADVLKGLVWACVQFGSAQIVRDVGSLGISTYKKVPGIGPRAPKVGNATVWTLGHMPGQLGLAQLAVLKVRVKFGTAQRLIEKAFEETAVRLGLPRAEIEEITVPTYGLDAVGVRREPMGEFTAELMVEPDGSSELRWLKGDGKTQKSIPASVKTEFAEELKDLKAAGKDLQRMIPAQKERLDSMFLARSVWKYSLWCERYLDHPLVGILARRLIWVFGEGAEARAGIYLNDQLVGVDNSPLQVTPELKVELWHPLGRPVAEVLAWREWLERHQIQQPFKQAHREVYLVTDAELNTRVYSNRYAAHVLRQHQYNALCAARGWKNKLRLMVDDSYPPTTRYLPLWNLRAEFWVEGAGTEYGTDTNETGTYLYLTTDQVRFYPLDASQRHAHAAGGGYGRAYGATGDDTPIEMNQVPPLVFSEIMRDVDLFVGVASVANDPTWSDGGPTGRYVDYWQSFSFGELTATANTRKELLQRLIPRLKIAPQCSFADKFLVVSGKLRTYKIHLGSGNILMEPNDQYLCIVPKQSAVTTKEKMFLPFEGDNMLSIILSKALLLAADEKISDPTITRQIGVAV